MSTLVGGWPAGSNGEWVTWFVWVVVGVGLPLAFALLRLDVRVEPGVVRIHFRPLVKRDLRTAEMTQIEPRTYRPLREYGGWGIRGLGRKRAYSVKGDRGVELTFNDGRAILIGSQEPDRLACAIEDAREPGRTPT